MIHNPIKSLALLVTFILTFAPLSYPSEEMAPQIKKTARKYQEWMQQFLQKHLISIVRDGDKIKIKSDGQLGIFDPNWEWLTEFTLIQSSEFLQSPDHHASTKFKLIEIKEDKIIIQYESRFDHRSFGPNLMTIDVGTVELKYK